MTPTDRLAKAREARRARMAANAVSTVPKCDRTLAGTKRHPPRACRRRCVQNEPERTRGIWWCPACGRYPWGSGGGRAGGGPDKVPAEAWGG